MEEAVFTLTLTREGPGEVGRACAKVWKPESAGHGAGLSRD